MQPLELRAWLLAAELGEPDPSAERLWRSLASQPYPGHDYLRRMGLLIAALSTLTAFATAGFLGVTHLLPTGRTLLAVALIGAVVATLLGAALAAVMGVAYGAAVAAALGVTLTGSAGMILAMLGGVQPGRTLGLLLGATAGVAVGFALDTSRAIARGDSRPALNVSVSALLGGGAYGLAFSSVAGAVDPRVAATSGLAAGAAFAVALAATSWRLPLFLGEAATELVLYRLAADLGLRTLRFSPVLFHDLSPLPLPGLWRHVLLATAAEPEVADRVCRRCALLPGQRRVAARLVPIFQLREMSELAARRDFASAVSLHGTWLPGVSGATPWLLGLREAARFLEAAVASLIPYHRLQHIGRADAALRALENQFAADLSPLATPLRQCIGSWRDTAEALRKESASAAIRQIPNPFRTEPLTPDQGELFRGRAALIRQIDSLLAQPAESFSIALIGPRRCGKTSLLLMLPKLLPDAVCIFFDLQDNPLDSPVALLAALARRAHEQAARDRRLEIPLLAPGPPFEAGRAWFDALDRLGAGRRILLCIDEFERLEEQFPGEPQELAKLLGLLRGTIQHRRNLRLLVSGAAAFDDLGPLWNDNFINLRELRIGHLDRSTAVDLLRHPVPEFPAHAIPQEVAEAVCERTGGQPYLLQLYGSLLISALNEAGRSEATCEDVKQVGERILTEAVYYFRYLMQSAPPEARRMLGELATGAPASGSPSIRAWLRRRQLLTDDGILGIPLFGDYLLAEMDPR